MLSQYFEHYATGRLEEGFSLYFDSFHYRKGFNISL